MRFCRFFFTMCFVVLLSGVVFAQARATWQPSVESSARYKHMVAQLLNDPVRFDYSSFRRYYASSDLYAPIGAEIKDKMMALAYVIETGADDAAVVDEAMREYQSYVTAHLAHVGIVSLALSFSREHAAFGDPAFLYKLQQGLLNDVIKSGNGRSLMQAYDIITLDEEVMLINQLKLGPVVRNDRHEGSVYYTMHDYVDDETGAGSTIFVNTTLPMRYLEAHKEPEKIDIFP